MPHRQRDGLTPHLLIVDDDPGSLRLLIEILKDLGSIDFAMDGAQALAAARARVPDMILLDIGLPDVDGFDVCRRLKADPVLAEVPVIFLTVRDDADTEVRALELGGVDFIAKPVRPDAVRARVGSRLRAKRATDKLLRTVVTDVLTGIANRRGFDLALEREWARAGREGVPLSLLMADVDHFKAFNDTLGHQAGDDCLRAVAAALGTVARRPGDMAARFGGEEFVVLLYACEPADAVGLAEAARASVEGLAIAHAASPSADHVTLSIGVAGCLPGRAGADSAIRDPAGLIRAADDALYDAKRGGRNRVAAPLPRAVTTGDGAA